MKPLLACLLAATLCTHTSLPAQDLRQGQLRQLRYAADSTLALFGIPGLALVVVHDTSVLLAEGFGIKVVDRPDAVGPHTLFGAASLSKAFTATLLALQVQAGGLHWHTPLKHYLPTQRWADAYLEQHLTTHDLLTHRTGLARHDMLWYGSPNTRQAIGQKLAHLPPHHGLRQHWRYQNIGYVVAGNLIEALTGLSYEAAVHQQLLLPLGMQRSNFSTQRMTELADFALPHHVQDGRLRSLAPHDVHNIAPAGGLNTSAHDLGRWLTFWLNEGRVGADTLLSPALLRDMLSPQSTTGRAPEFPETLHPTYGLGWYVQPYRGHWAAWHGGLLAGYSAFILLLPDKKIGVAVLCNLSGTRAPQALCHRVADELLGAGNAGWLQRFYQLQNQTPSTPATPRTSGTRPSHPLAAYVGSYQHPAYGLLAISAHGDSLLAHYNSFTAPLTHWHYDTFYGVSAEDASQDFWFSFATNAQGQVQAMHWQADASTAPIVFDRMQASHTTPHHPSTQPNHAPLLGHYDLKGRTMTVSVGPDGQLLLALPDTPPYTLVPTAEALRYDLKGVAGYAVVFITNREGRITALSFVQPGGAALARRKR